MANRAPPPGDLELLARFANTLDAGSGADYLDSPEKLASWYRKVGVLEGATLPDAADVAEAAAVRGALRGLMLRNHGEDVGPEAIATLNHALASLPLTPRLGDGVTPSLEAFGEGPRTALARIMAVVFGAMADGSWSRLKICRSDDCRWAFYDHSRNRSGSWCSMSVCGNRTKVRAYQQRAKAARTAS